MIFFLDPRVFPRILRETPRRHQCDIIVLDFLRCSARFVRDSDVFRCSACFVCGFWVLGTKPWMTIFFRVLCGWAFRTAPVTAGNAFSRRDLSIARRGARTRDKRPALTQQPNLYLEPKWLRCFWRAAASYSNIFPASMRLGGRRRTHHLATPATQRHFGRAVKASAC